MQAVNRRAIRRAVQVAGVVWLGLTAEIVLSNVVLPSPGSDDTAAVLVSYLWVFGALTLVGALAAGDGAGRRAQVVAGVVAGMLLGALAIGTFAVVDNVWLDIVSRQQPKMEGFAHSGASSTREYINTGLVGAAFGLTVALGVAGAVCGLVGGVIGDLGARRALPPA